MAPCVHGKFACFPSCVLPEAWCQNSLTQIYVLLVDCHRAYGVSLHSRLWLITAMHVPVGDLLYTHSTIIGIVSCKCAIASSIMMQPETQLYTSSTFQHAVTTTWAMTLSTFTRVSLSLNNMHNSATIRSSPKVHTSSYLNDKCWSYLYTQKMHLGTHITQVTTYRATDSTYLSNSACTPRTHVH